MEIKIQLRTLIIKDAAGGKAFSVRTLRTAEEIAAYIEESEKDIIADHVEEAVSDAYHK
jgi:hypothetical protein